MKSLLAIAFTAAACSPYKIVTRERSDWQACGEVRASSDGAVSCGGRGLAKVECFGGFPGGARTCKALVVTYGDGEVVPIYVAAGFDLGSRRFVGGNSNAYVDIAVYPELSPDGKWLWFKKSELLAKDQWVLFEFATGRVRERTASEILELREFEYSREHVELGAAGR